MLGTGIIKGMAETARNFLGSFYQESRMTTVQYPEQRLAVKENYRSFPFLIYDGKDSADGLRCIACKTCEKECPAECISIEILRDANGKPAKKPKVFDIDISVCMSCQICVEVCPFEAIRMDQVYEIATKNRFAPLLFHKEDLAKPNSYYHSIHPTEARETDERLEADRKKKKRLQPPRLLRLKRPNLRPPFKTGLLRQESQGSQRAKNKVRLQASENHQESQKQQCCFRRIQARHGAEILVPGKDENVLQQDQVVVK